MRISGDKEVLRKIASNDLLAFKQVYEKNFKSLVIFSRRFVLNTDVAEDIAQQCLLYLWEKRHSIKIKTSISAYLFTSARNAALNQIKKDANLKKYIKNFLLEFHGEADDVNNGYELAKQNEIKDVLELAIDDLPESCQQIFRLSRHNGLKNREIAELLSISKRTVETQIYRALKILKLRLADYVVAGLFLIFFTGA